MKNSYLVNSRKFSAVVLKKYTVNILPLLSYRTSIEYILVTYMLFHIFHIFILKRNESNGILGLKNKISAFLNCPYTSFVHISIWWIIIFFSLCRNFLNSKEISLSSVICIAKFWCCCLLSDFLYSLSMQQFKIFIMLNLKNFYDSWHVNFRKTFPLLNY